MKGDKEANYREDLRKLPFVTIDGEDAKDFDDAVCCERKKGKGFTLYVAIADVSHYVQVNTALDTEAQLRGKSVYFPGHVIPMLPEHLSNGLCSLKPKEDRLVMVCEMEISQAGEIDSYIFYEGIIFSHARLTYTEVAAMLQPPKTDAETLLQQRISAKHQALVQATLARTHGTRCAGFRNRRDAHHFLRAAPHQGDHSG